MENNEKNNAQSKVGRIGSARARLADSTARAAGPPPSFLVPACRTPLSPGLWRKCKRPAAVADVRARKSETRISAIADFAGKGKQEKKALPLSLLAGRHHENPGALEKVFADFSHVATQPSPPSPAASLRRASTPPRPALARHAAPRRVPRVAPCRVCRRR